MPLGENEDTSEVKLDQEIFDWAVLLGRWLHITVGVTWIGTSIFFMWLDRTLRINMESQREGHVGELWMVHGGGFYHVEKLLMGPTKVPESLHWFKWESYWTWISGVFLVGMIFYTGEGTFLLDSSISDITYGQGVTIGIFSIVGSWIFYDFLWERKVTRDQPFIGHFLTMAWFIGMSYFLCQTLSGRAAYIHIGAMLGTWMTANVFLRIIPRQVKMVEASKNGEPVNQEWGKNAKNRSTHNTYFTLPVIFIMLSNHFPSTYGHQWNWLILLLLSGAGAAIREYFVARLDNQARSKSFGAIGLALLVGVIVFTREPMDAGASADVSHGHQVVSGAKVAGTTLGAIGSGTVKGIVRFEGTPPERKKLRLPVACSKQFPGGELLSNQILIKQGRIKNVLIRITKGLEGSSYSDVPSEVVTLDQRGCLYTPKVLAARVGQKVMFVNSDSVFHNVRSVTKKNKHFNVMMPRKDQKNFMVFHQPELFLETKCDVHPWMGAYIAIMDHPYFYVTNEDGEFSISNLPAGDYTMEAWHEIFGTLKKEFSVAKNESANMEFVFTEKSKVQ